MDLIDRITKIISAHRQVIKDLQSDKGIISEIERSALIITETLCEGGTLFTFGNGGSAADAQHIVAELVGRFYLERPGFKAIALSTDGSIMTSLANDFGFDTVFSRQIEAMGKEGDAALAISTSGTSPNVLKGIEAAQNKGMRILGLTGKSGSSMAALCDSTIIVPSQETPRIQEAQELIYHIVCELVEQGVCNRL